MEEKICHYYELENVKDGKKVNDYTLEFKSIYNAQDKSAVVPVVISEPSKIYNIGGRKVPSYYKEEIEIANNWMNKLTTQIKN